MRGIGWNLLGLGLFLFIPVVLFLFVRHPEPVGASLAAGVVLMLGHRFLARPYMARVAERKCIWCNRFLAPGDERQAVPVRAGAADVRFVACARHGDHAARFFAWVDRLRLPLRLGIGLPLVALLTVLACAALGLPAPVELGTNWFRLLVGVTVEIAALGPRLGAADRPARAAFPLHNFTLLGLRNILWIFRLVGIWWIFSAGRALFFAG
jgi:hypothetical protein